MTAWGVIRGVCATLCGVLLLLLLTSGWGLMAGYVPSDAEAFDSIVHLRQAGDGGRQLRAVHYYLSSALVAGGFIYLLTTFLTGAHVGQPRAWWWAVALYFLILGLSFTGYFLPMDQNAYWGTMVRLGIVETVPLAGARIADVLRGGPLFNAASLPRFYALHVAILPFVAMICLLPLARRAITGVRARGDLALWLGVGVVGVVVAYFAASHSLAPLELAADPNDTEYVPRPEWYFLWLFQFGKYVTSAPWVQSFLLPVGGVALLLWLPRLRNLGAGSRASLAAVWSAAWIVLTGLSIHEDRELPAKLQYEEARWQRAAAQYEELCLECHGEDGRGDGSQSRAFGLDAKDFTSPQYWLESLPAERGRSIRDGKGEDMPAFRRKLGDDEIDALLDYLEVEFAPIQNDAQVSVADPGLGSNHG